MGDMAFSCNGVGVVTHEGDFSGVKWVLVCVLLSTTWTVMPQ